VIGLRYDDGCRPHFGEEKKKEKKKKRNEKREREKEKKKSDNAERICER
jgi:hypothetical protein